jgi:putative aldouronate transport system substrate-binding protein
VAAANIPNVFMPWNGNEADLAKNGALADLTDLLPKYAPNMWKLIPQSVWNTVKANDPTGQGHIYWIPTLSDYQKESGLIRKDWLDKLNLPMPKTTADLVNVFTAFRDKDPNGNGQKDEIPTSGRQGATWMNPLFEPFGVAMWEGNPMFDVYDGQLTYSGVTKNAKDALTFIADLYKQGLLDKEFALNDKTKWDGKTNASKTGLYFHWAQTTSVNHLFAIEKSSGVKADIAVLPPVQAPGYEGKGFITTFKVGLPQFVVSAKQDQAHLMASMKFLNEIADTSKWDDMYWGIEGMDYEVKNGAKQYLPYDQSKQQLAFVPSKYWGTLDFNIKLAQEAETPDTKWAIEQDIRNMKDLQPYVRDIASDGMPDSVYNNYPDIKNNKLWQEYATKIIIGEYPISKFDEFVQKWNASGGAEVTKAARAWYDKVKAVK